MISEELIKEYFKGGNATEIKTTSMLKENLEAIKQIGDELDEEKESRINRGKETHHQSEKPNPAR